MRVLFISALVACLAVAAVMAGGPANDFEGRYTYVSGTDLYVCLDDDEFFGFGGEATVFNGIQTADNQVEGEFYTAGVGACNHGTFTAFVNDGDDLDMHTECADDDTEGDFVFAREDSSQQNDLFCARVSNFASIEDAFGGERFIQTNPDAVWDWCVDDNDNTDDEMNYESSYQRSYENGPGDHYLVLDGFSRGQVFHTPTGGVVAVGQWGEEDASGADITIIIGGDDLHNFFWVGSNLVPDYACYGLACQGSDHYIATNDDSPDINCLYNLLASTNDNEGILTQSVSFTNLPYYFQTYSNGGSDDDSDDDSSSSSSSDAASVVASSMVALVAMVALIMA